LTELRTLTLFGNALTELNFSQATFDNLLPRPGFSIDSEEITSLLLDGAALSQGSFDVILDQTTSTVDVSLVNLTFTDGNPSDLSALLSIATLDNVRIDPTLYSLYAAELDEFDAIIGNTVTVVPEPLSIVLLILSSVAWQQRRRVDW